MSASEHSTNDRLRLQRQADHHWSWTSIASEVVVPAALALLVFWAPIDIAHSDRLTLCIVLLSFGPVSLAIYQVCPHDAQPFAHSASQLLLAATCAAIVPQVWHPAAAASIGLLTICVVYQTNLALLWLTVLSYVSLTLVALFSEPQPNWYVTLLAGGAALGGSITWFRGWDRARVDLMRSHDELLERARAFSWTADRSSHEILTIAGNVQGVLGFRAEELIGLPISEVFTKVRDWREGDDAHSVQTARHRNGHTVTVHQVQLSGSPTAAVRGVSTDITEAAHATEALRYQAEHDSLTGLSNRQAIRYRADEALESEADAALIVIDLDRFKEVNDTLGHATGDQLLQVLSQRFVAAFDHAATVARIGGDEFALLLPDTDLEQAKSAAERIAALAGEPMQIEGFALSTSASIGIAVSPQHGTSYDELLRSADIASYAAKRSGGGIEVFSSVPDQLSRRRLRLLTEMSSALDAGEFELFLQPKVRLSDGQLVGAEGLARWRHPEFGVLPPAEFLHAIEVASDHQRFTTEMMQQAIDFIATLRASASVLHVAVNLGAMSLRDEGLPDRVAGMLKLAGVAGSSLVFEIVESDLVQGDPIQSAVIERLRSLGIRVSIDDFGTGYSNFGQLKSLTADEIKIDRLLVSGLGIHDHDSAIVESIVSLARRLGYLVVAEGVEHQRQVDLLRSMGCDVAQGFLFARPISQGEFLRRVVEGSLLEAPDGVVTRRDA